MSPRTSPPFRADHVGSLLRPQRLLQAREDVALGELMRELLVDRGPSSVPKTGIPYLSKEGYPYRVFDKAHPELIRSAKQLKILEAIAVVREAVGPVPPRKIASMFKLCLTREEIRD